MKKLFTNPFRADTLKPAPVAAPAPERTGPLLGEDQGIEQTSTILAPGYGGIRVRGAASGTEAMLQILDCLVNHRSPLLMDTLAVYDVALVQSPERPKVGFYCQRHDGWVLAIPSAQHRETAIFQLVQALLELARGPFSKPLRDAGITPYRE